MASVSHNDNGRMGVTTTLSAAISRAPLWTFSILTFAICMMVLVADGIDAQLLGIVAPRVIEDFGVDRGIFGWAMVSAATRFCSSPR